MPTSSHEKNADERANASFLRRALRAALQILTVGFWREWFVRPCGGREAIRLATPIVVSTASFALLNFADRVYLTWWDSRAMTAAFQSGCLLWATTTFAVGIASYVNAFASQYFGAGERRRIGLNVWQGVFFGLVAGLFYVAATPLVERLFLALRSTPEAAVLARNYWFYGSLGSSALIGHEPLGAYFCAQRDMKTVMAIGLATVGLNVVLDPLFIFVLKLGCEGAAMASAISLWFKFFLYLWLAFRRDKTVCCGLREGMRLDLSELKKLTRFGSMSATQQTAENLCFTFFVLLTGYFGEEYAAAAGIAFNLDCLAFMPIVGLGIATTTMVGNEIGAGRPELAARSVRTTAALGTFLTGVFALAFFVAPNFFIDAYGSRAGEDFSAIREPTVFALRFVSAYMLFDAINVVLASALRGAGDAKFIMMATFATASIVSVALLFGVFLFGRGLTWCWTFISLYVVSNACIFLVRLAQGGWKNRSLVAPTVK